MMDMRPESFPKKELNFDEINYELNRLNDEQLYKLESWIQNLREHRKQERRKNEIIAEMNNLFAELTEMGCTCHYQDKRGNPILLKGSIHEWCGSGMICID